MTPEQKALALRVANIAEAAGEKGYHNQSKFFGGVSLKQFDPDSYERVQLSAISDGSCGTSACLGGFTVLQTLPGDYLTNGARVWKSDGQELGWTEEIAANELGLTTDQADTIFFCFDEEASISRLRYVAENPDAEPEEIEDKFPDISFTPTW